ncbi:MAG TPA: L-threonylcarbamoyladenylate synthase [Bacteroidales bacterium]|mgnify:FL=1|nr:L-threonylcarbamoyladenylate synthase [Bacteroidales bacterium]
MLKKRINDPGLYFEDDIGNSLKCLREGGVLLYPTDTIWGLGCDPTHLIAVQKVFRIKNRADSRSLIILVNSTDMLARYVKEIPATALELISVSDSPLTIIYPEGKNLAEGICNDDGTIGIRICNEPFCKALISAFRKPIVSTSANISGLSSPAHFGEIDNYLKSKVDYIVKYRQDDRQKSSPSPVIRIDINGTLKILRM